MDPELVSLDAELGGCGQDIELDQLDKLPHYIILAGEKFELKSNVPVVTWESDPYWSFIRVKDEFATLESPVCVPRRFKDKSGEGVVETLAQLSSAVKMVVLHSDGLLNSCGTFKTLAKKGYSTHFMVDWNGVIYQALDPAWKAIHAEEFNDMSIGIDLNLIHINLQEDPGFAYPVGKVPGMADEKYKRPISDPMEINGGLKKAYGYTDAQYVSLIELLKALTTHIGIKKQVPLDAKGDIIPTVLEDTNFEGIVAHWHLKDSRWDPGPGFDWLRVYHALRGEFTHFPMELEGVKDIPDLLELTKVEAAAENYFRNTERGKGGYYPIGLNQNWHGGVHLHAPQGTPVRAIIDGKLAAARFGKPSELGSANFVLLRHDIEMPNDNVLKFYTLYMHLDEMDVSDPRQATKDWLRKAFRVYSGREKDEEDALEVGDVKKDDHYYGDKEAPKELAPDEEERRQAELKKELEKDAQPYLEVDKGPAALRKGKVALFDTKEHPIEIRSGEDIGHVGWYSGSGEQQNILHLEIFTDDSYRQSIDMGVHGAFWVEIEEDVTSDLQVKTDQILGLFEGPNKRKSRDSYFAQVHQRVPLMDIQDFFSMDSENQEARAWLRKTITRHVSEWSDQVNWVAALSAAQEWDKKIDDFLHLFQDAKGEFRQGQFIDTIKQFLPFIWLNSEVAKEVGLKAENGVLYHFHPIHFLMWLTFHSSPRLKAISQGKSMRQLRVERQKRMQADLEARLAGETPVTEDSSIEQAVQADFEVVVEEESPREVLKEYLKRNESYQWKLPTPLEE